ncbi:hypothetical protein PLICRDRAFT_43374 [Plicaturopsis crispa FD-325 SS-3]|nr:hypothetical protein PLICRDRAFT_43374 [Plicaturopsis crispa FD-325 SS-3]
MSLYLCVDCGGSKTAAAISSSSGEIVGRSLGGPSNFAYLGPELFKAAVATAVSKALQTCSVPPSGNPVPLPPPADTPQFAAAWFGISGADSSQDIATIETILSALLNIPIGDRLIIANDAHLLASPVRLHPDVSQAVAVIAGTGSCITSFRETESGGLKELGRTGGWGWILGDEGGGFHVGRETIRQILLQTDRASLGGTTPPTVLANGRKTLTDKVLERFDVRHPMELLTAVHVPDPAPNAAPSTSIAAHLLMAREKRLSSLAPLVFASAFDDGDPLAFIVLRAAASALADQIVLMLDKTAGPNAIDASETVICFGGSLVGIPKYREIVLDDLRGRGHVFKHVEFVDDAAAVGAVGLAEQFKGKTAAI